MEMFSDSRLVVGQVNGELEAQDARIQEYLGQVRHIQTKFESFKLSHVPRSGNTHANSLATLATSSAQNLPRVILVEDLCTLPNKERLALGPSNQVRAELDGSYTAIPRKEHIA